MCKYFLRKVYLALELLNLANTYWEVLCLCSWWRDCRYNFPWELRKPVWKEVGKDGSYNVTSLFGSSWLFVLMTFLGGRGSLCVRILYYVLAGILPACLYGDNGKEAFPEIWKHLLVSPKNWFCWISYRSPSIYSSGVLLFVNLFVLKSIVLCRKSLYIVLGIGLHLISVEGNLWSWEYIFTMTDELYNRNYCFKKCSGIL